MRNVFFEWLQILLGLLGVVGIFLVFLVFVFLILRKRKTSVDAQLEVKNLKKDLLLKKEKVLKEKQENGQIYHLE